MSMFLPSDVPQADYERHQMSIMLQESTKPIIFVGIEIDSTVMAIDMAAAVAGGLKALQQYPFVINYVNTASAFHHNGESLQRLLYAAERNIPSIYDPGRFHGALYADGRCHTAELRGTGTLGTLFFMSLQGSWLSAKSTKNIFLFPFLGSFMI
jgi:hypothetical protein